MGQGGWFEGAMGALIIVALAQAALLAVMLTPHVSHTQRAEKKSPGIVF